MRWGGCGVDRWAVVLLGTMLVSSACARHVSREHYELQAIGRAPFGDPYPLPVAGGAHIVCAQDANIRLRTVTHTSWRSDRHTWDYGGGAALATIGALIVSVIGDPETDESDYPLYIGTGVVFIGTGIGLAIHGLVKQSSVPEPTTRYSPEDPEFWTVESTRCSVPTPEGSGGRIYYCDDFTPDPEVIGTDEAALALKSICSRGTDADVQCSPTRIAACVVSKSFVVKTKDMEPITLQSSTPEDRIIELVDIHVAPITDAVSALWSAALQYRDIEVQVVTLAAQPVAARFVPKYAAALQTVKADIETETGERRALLTDMYVRAAELADYATTPRGSKLEYDNTMRVRMDELRSLRRRIDLIEAPPAARTVDDEPLPATPQTSQ